MSKVRLNITISQEARDRLGDSPSQWVEAMAMGTPPTTQDKPLTEGRVLYLIQQEIKNLRLATPKVEEKKPLDIPGVQTGSDLWGA